MRAPKAAVAHGDGAVAGGPGKVPRMGAEVGKTGTQSQVGP